MQAVTTLERCPACRSSSLSAGPDIGSGEAAQHFVRRYLDPERHDALRAHVETLWNGSTARMLACADCGLRCADPLVGGDATFYNLAYPGDPDYPADKWEYRRTLAALDDIPPSARGERSILEIGAGDGAFLEKLAARGFDPARMEALEYNEHSLYELRRKGFRAEAASFTDREPGSRHDLIFLFQVLEHLDRPDLVFERLAASLCPGGRIHVAVPNAARIDYNEANGSLRDMPPNHVTRWSVAAFERLAERHGLRVVDVERESTSFRAFAVRDVGYRYLARTMTEGSLAARTYRRSGDPRERAFRLAAGAAIAIARTPTWLARAAELTGFGDSLRVTLGRAGDD